MINVCSNGLIRRTLFHANGMLAFHQKNSKHREHNVHQEQRKRLRTLIEFKSNNICLSSISERRPEWIKVMQKSRIGKCENS